MKTIPTPEKTGVGARPKLFEEVAGLFSGRGSMSLVIFLHLITGVVGFLHITVAVYGPIHGSIM